MRMENRFLVITESIGIYSSDLFVLSTNSNRVLIQLLHVSKTIGDGRRKDNLTTQTLCTPFNSRSNCIIEVHYSNRNVDFFSYIWNFKMKIQLSSEKSFPKSRRKPDEGFYSSLSNSLVGSLYCSSRRRMAIYDYGCALNSSSYPAFTNKRASGKTQ